MRVCVLVFLFVLMLAGSIVSLVRGEKREREKNNRRKKLIGRCGSRRLPGIVRATEERGRPRKSETITKRARPISGNHTVCQTGSSTVI